MHHNFITHYNAWRNAIIGMINSAPPPTVDSDDRAYWKHELNAYDEAFASISAHDQDKQWWLQGPIIAYASSHEGCANQVISKAQFDSALPKNREKFDVPLSRLHVAEPANLQTVQKIIDELAKLDLKELQAVLMYLEVSRAMGEAFD